MTVWPMPMNFFASANPSPRVTPVIRIFICPIWRLRARHATFPAFQLRPSLATLEAKLVQTRLPAGIHDECQFL